MQIINTDWTLEHIMTHTCPTMHCAWLFFIEVCWNWIHITHLRGLTGTKKDIISTWQRRVLAPSGQKPQLKLKENFYILVKSFLQISMISIISIVHGYKMNKVDWCTFMCKPPWAWRNIKRKWVEVLFLRFDPAPWWCCIQQDKTTAHPNHFELMAQSIKRVSLKERRKAEGKGEGWPERFLRLYLYPSALCFPSSLFALKKHLLRQGKPTNAHGDGHNLEFNS